MKTFIYLLFTLFLFSNIEGQNYSIYNIINFLQQTGYYDLINAIKNNFGKDVAVGVCENLIQSPHCEEVVKVYMTRKYQRYTIKLPKVVIFAQDKKLKPRIDELIPDPIVEPVRPLLECILDFYDVLMRNMKEATIVNDFLRRINSNQRIINYMPREV